MYKAVYNKWEVPAFICVSEGFFGSVAVARDDLSLTPAWNCEFFPTILGSDAREKFITCFCLSLWRLCHLLGLSHTRFITCSCLSLWSLSHIITCSCLSHWSFWAQLHKKTYHLHLSALIFHLHIHVYRDKNLISNACKVRVKFYSKCMDSQVPWTFTQTNCIRSGRSECTGSYIHKKWKKSVYENVVLEYDEETHSH